MLIENGFDVNQNVVTNLNGMGNTPIAHSACYNDDREMLQYLINKGADPNKKTSLKNPLYTSYENRDIPLHCRIIKFICFNCFTVFLRCILRAPV